LASGDASIRPFHVEIPQDNLTRDEVITMTCVTNTRISSRSRVLGKHARPLRCQGRDGPAAVRVFPRELYQVPRSWAERAYLNLIDFNELDRGNHFAAWQEPDLFSTEIRAAFRSLR